ncbi:MAG: hypothetical protein Q7S37_00955 [bacterium]|nr:hypothetical protein [bacterium]
MDSLIKNLSEDQLKKLAKKDKKLLIELQKEIHQEKAEYYERLKNFYWTIAVILVLTLFLLALKIQSHYFNIISLGLLISFLIALVGGKLFYIDKPTINQKAITRSKVLDAMEIESISLGDSRKRIIGLILLTIGGLIFLVSFITMIVIKE